MAKLRASVLLVVVVALTSALVSPTHAQRFTSDCKNAKDLLIEDLNDRQSEPWQLGHLYDVRSDQVFGNSVWENSVIQKHTTTRTTSNQKRKFVHVKSSSVVVDEFNIGLGVTVRILFIKFGASANLKFTLTTTREKERFQFSQELRTVTSTLNEDLLGQVLVPEIGTPTGLDVLARLGATHVITSISYGGSLDIAFDASAKEIKANFKISGSGLVKGLLQLMNEEGKSGVGPALPLLGDIDVKVDSDIGFPFKINNFGKSVEAIQKFEGLLSGENGGRGVAYSALLTPICRFYDVPVPKSPFRAVTSTTARVIQRLIAGQRDMLARGEQLYREAKNKGGFTATFQLLDRWVELLDVYNSKLGVKLSDMLAAVRSYAMEEVTVLEFCEIARKSPMSFEGSRQWLDSVEQTLDFYDEVESTVTYQLQQANQDAEEGEDFSALFEFSTNFASFRNKFLPTFRNRFGTVVLLAFVPESESTLDFRSKYLADVVKSIEEYGSLTGDTDALVPQALFMDENNLVETRIKMIEFVELINLSREGNTCVVPPCFRGQADAFVIINFSENEADFRAAGVEIDTSSIILFRDGELFNKDFEPCATADDPRNGLDSINPPCRFSGNQDVPDGLLCTFGDSICENRCGADNRCRSNECTLSEDWFLISVLDGNVTDHCATTEPERPGQVLMTPCSEGGPVITQQWEWNSGQIRSLATFECLTSSVNLGVDVMRTLPCVASDDQLWQQSANEGDRAYQTRLRLVKNPDSCVTIFESDISVNMVTDLCADVGATDNVGPVDGTQVITLPHLFRIPNRDFVLCLESDETLPFGEQLYTAACTGAPNQRFFQAASRDAANEFFWFQYHLLQPGVFSSVADHRAINAVNGTLYIDDGFLLADTTFSLDDFGRIGIRLDEAGSARQCVAHERGKVANTSELSVTDCADPITEPTLMNLQYWYSCYDVCEENTCAHVANSQCVSYFEGTQCECNPGWTGPRGPDGNVTKDDCSVKLSECTEFACPEDGFYCQLVDRSKLKRSYKFSSAGRVCIPLSTCNPGEYMALAPTSTSDRECAACPPNTYQYKFNYEGWSCISITDGQNVTAAPTEYVPENITTTEAPTVGEESNPEAAPAQGCTNGEKLVLAGTATQRQVCLKCTKSNVIPVCDPDTRLCFCLDKTFAQTKLSNAFVIVGPEVTKETPDVPLIAGSLFGTVMASIIGLVAAKVILIKRARRKQSKDSTFQTENPVVSAGYSD